MSDIKVIASTDDQVSVTAGGDDEVVVKIITGEEGPVGPQGPQGDAATVDVGLVTVVNPDVSPDVVNSGTTGDAIFDFDLPRAPTLEVGTVTPVNPDQPPTVTDVVDAYTGDVSFDFELPNSPTFGVGDVTTGSPETQADVTDVGVDGNIVLDFFIPRGANGWSPELAVVVDGARRVLQVVDWVGGEGTKPPVGDYVGSGGLVSDISLAVDIRGPEGPATVGTLDELSDVNFDYLVDGQVLTYDGNTNLWVNRDVAATLGDLTDVEIDDPQQGQVLAYDAVTGEWVNAAVAANLGDLNDVTIASVANDDFLRYNGTSGDWENVAVNTDGISEGSGNLYFTDQRVDDRIALAALGDLADVDVTSVSDGDVLVFDDYSGEWVPGAAGAKGAGGDQVFWENDQTVTTNYEITAGRNALTAGPVEIQAGVTVEVPAGSVWTVV